MLRAQANRNSHAK